MSILQSMCSTYIYIYIYILTLGNSSIRMDNHFFFYKERAIILQKDNTPNFHHKDSVSQKLSLHVTLHPLATRTTTMRKYISNIHRHTLDMNHGRKKECAWGSHMIQISPFYFLQHQKETDQSKIWSHFRIWPLDVRWCTIRK